MSAVCASCGTAHGPAQRYCLGCGALVGRRAVEIDRAIAYRRDGGVPSAPTGAAPPTVPAQDPLPAAVEEPPAVAPGEISVWRRPVTSIATAVALAAGITAGFLTSPQGGAARSDAPVVLSGRPGTVTPSADVPAETTPDAPADADAETPAPIDEEPPVDDATGPVADDAATTPVDGDAGTAPIDTTSDPAATGSTTKSTSKAKAEKKTAAKKSGTAASKLPEIDHVWVIGVNAPLATEDEGYVGDTLLSRATELPKYTPASTDPLIGAAALVAGAEPSANATTIVRQLTTAKRSWRAYAPGAPNCTDPDATGGIPLLSFPTVTSAADCADHVAGLGDLAGDLDAPPAFSYVATDPALDAAGLGAQLRQIVEPIRKSAAFKQAGLIAIVPTATDPITATSALLLSPFAAGSTSISTSFGPYALLRTFADLLGVDRPGHAADKDVAGLGPDILAPKG